MDSADIFIAKPTKYRVRGPTWTDDEVHKLFLAWSQPKIYSGFLNEKKKKEVFVQLSSELNKYSVSRSWEECRAKIKNLKADYKKARENNNPQGFRYFTLMDKIMTTTPTPEDNSSPGISLHDVQQQPVEIEFEIMSDGEMDFEGMKGGGLPIQICQSGSILIPGSSRYGAEEEANVMGGGDLHIETDHPDQEEVVHHPHHHEASPSLAQSPLTSSHETPIVVLGEAAHHPTTSGANAEGKCKRKGAGHEMSQKRRKLQSLSEKMAETVSRILSQTTSSLVQEIKASEERYMMEEEKRRLQDRKREESMLQNLINAIAHPNQLPQTDKIQTEPDVECESRMLEMINSSDDPCAMTFDLLASRITTTLTEQHKEAEQMIQQWEFKMQDVEMKHTENLFKMILTAVRSHSID